MTKRRKRHASPFTSEWALLFLIVLLAAMLRFWHIGSWPPGLYRDEAINGLDALAVLNGYHPIFFPANNGREPAFIYLAAFFIKWLGPTALAVRIGTAVTGTLTTIPTYLLTRRWFGKQTALLTATLWAITLWPVHLSRIGLRVVLLVPMLALTFWLGTEAYTRQKKWLWAVAGLVYGLTLYTYLAARLTPALLGTAAIYLWLTGRRSWLRGSVWFALAAAVTLSPLLIAGWHNPAILLGRTGQVSILNPAVNDGRLLPTLFRQTTAALGMFLWQGDDILRHNPAGRPLFDWLMAVPFLVGTWWTVRHWRRPAAGLTLLWVGSMLGATIFAEDTPHFLRAAGILPAVLILPAIGLHQIATSRHLADWLRPGLVLGLLAGSLLLTVRDYTDYVKQPDTAYLFEAGARQLAEQINWETAVLPDTAVYLDKRYIEGWPSIPFLLTNPHVTTYTPKTGVPAINGRAQIYAWPYDTLAFIPPALPPTATIYVESGPLARGDLEPEPYPLYTRYLVQPGITLPPTARIGDTFWLYAASAAAADGVVQVDVVWGAETAVDPTLTAFVQLIGPNGLAAQADAPPGQGLWLPEWWRPGLLVHERRTLPLPSSWKQDDYAIIIGVYDASITRLPVTAVDGTPSGEYWRVPLSEN